MAIDVKLPDLGDGIESGDVLEIYVSVGDSVSKEQGLLELETDKATVTVPSPKAGKISKILVSAGETVAVGSVIIQMEAEGAKADSPDSDPAPSQDKTSDTSADKDSAAASKKQSSKPSESPSTSPEAGSASEPQRQSAPPPSQTSKGSPTISATHSSAAVTSGSGSAQPKPSAGSPSRELPDAIEDDSVAADGMLVAASPAVRRFAREVGVDLTNVVGSGEGDRITREDVLRAVRDSSSRAASMSPSSGTTKGPGQKQAKQSATEVSPAKSDSTSSDAAKDLPGTPSQDDYGPVRLERLSKIRKTIASQMHKSWTTAPHVTNFDDADVTELEAIRVSSKDDYSARGIKLTSLPFLLKAVATALRNHPMMNAMLDSENEQIVYRDYVNLGVAVDTPRGLVVPNIRNAHTLSIPEIARALADMANRVRNGDFSVGELRGGTFTISNLGAIGGTYSTPIINVPEVAILLVGRTRKLPVVMNDDSIKIRQMMPLSLSYDHRLVDGGTAARFLNDVISLLETPSRLLLAIS